MSCPEHDILHSTEALTPGKTSTHSHCATGMFHRDRKQDAARLESSIRRHALQAQIHANRLPPQPHSELVPKLPDMKATLGQILQPPFLNDFSANNVNNIRRDHDNLYRDLRARLLPWTAFKDIENVLHRILQDPCSSAKKKIVAQKVHDTAKKALSKKADVDGCERLAAKCQTLLKRVEAMHRKEQHNRQRAEHRQQAFAAYCTERS